MRRAVRTFVGAVLVATAAFSAAAFAQAFPSKPIRPGHHGQLAACATMEEATMLGIFIEGAAC